MKRIKKRYYVLTSLALIVFLLLFFLSTIIRNYLNNNSQELIGRKVELENLHINYFRVAVRAINLKVYEANATDTFAGFKELYVNFDPTRLLRNEYSFSSILLDSLFVKTIQDEQGFNFDDMIPAEDTTAVEVTDTIPSKPFRFAIHNIKFKQGHISFLDKTVDNEMKLENFSLDLPLIAWDSESSDVGIEFQLGEKGKVYVGAHVNQRKQEYNVDFRVDKFGLKDISSYVENTIDVGGIDGYVNANLKIYGSIENTMEVYVSGSTSVDSLHLWEPDGTDLFWVQYAGVNIDTLDIASQRYNITDISINQPIITASLQKDMSNFERVLLPVMETDSLATDSISTIDSTATASELRYRVGQFKITNGEVKFTDNTLYRPFIYDLKAINLDVKNVSEKAEEVPVNFAINLNDQGKLSGQSTINMLQPEIFDLQAKLEKLKLLSFSPYSEYHIARPITQGRFSYDLSVNMTPTHMTNTNDIKIKELEIGDKTTEEPQIKAPVKLGLYLMKDPNDAININLPVEGNPSDPDFSVSKIIWKALSNLIIKAAASPFNALGNLVGTRPEELENIPMPYAQDSLSIDQRKTLDKIAHILEKKPQLNFSFVQQTDPETEKNKLAILMAKKQMLAEKMPLNNEQQIARYNERLNEMEDSDPEFMNYIATKVQGSEGVALSNACRNLVGENEVNDAFTKLLINRNENLSYYLLQEKGVDSTSIDISTADLRNLPEQLKSCNYKVEVSID
ncbi:MAG: DUF748 domain-containing protein [Carboxylicivirga sp.]|jgi:hypothetical protein|nr:DUF748 domain-containing protein [Carboxylicivirga sp.]